jgi:hypothetical protein
MLKLFKIVLEELQSFKKNLKDFNAYCNNVNIKSRKKKKIKDQFRPSLILLGLKKKKT